MLSRFWNYYQIQFQITLATQLQYRVGLIIWMIDIVLTPTIYLVVWQTTVGEGEIAGFTAGGFAAYYIALMVVDHLTQQWAMWEFEYRIRVGEISQWMLRPFHPVHRDIIQNVSYKFLMLIVLLPAVVLLTLVFQPDFNTPPWALVMVIPAVILAAALSFTLGWMVGMIAFWTTRTQAINNLYYLVILFCAGQLAPLEVMPPVIQSIASALPFRWILAFPVEVFLGRVTPEYTLMGYVIQLAWLGASLILFNVMWQLAAQRYSAVGG
jgi:ABC-2 type transport system permease protein